MTGTMDQPTRAAALLAAAAAKGVGVASYVEPERHHLVVSGHRVHVLDWGGDTGAAPVVLLHGIRLTAHTWDLVCLGLRGPVRPLALDLRGHGESEWSPVRDYRVASVADDVVGLIDWIGSPVHLVGHSFGALVATQIALEHPALVRRLALVDAGPRLSRTSPRRRPSRDDGADRAASGGSPANGRFASVDDAVAAALKLNPRREERLLRSSLRNNLREHPDGTWSWKYDTDGVGPTAPFDFAEATRVWEGFASIGHSTLVIRGSESRLFTKEDLANAAALNPMVRTTEVDGAGHSVQGDSPAGLLAVLRPFVVAS